MRFIRDNCFKYNGPSDLARTANEMLDDFATEIEKIEAPQCLRRGRVDLTELPLCLIGWNNHLRWIEINDRRRLRISDAMNSRKD